MNLEDNLARVLSAMTDGLRPQSRLRVSDWAEQHRILPQASNEGGRWKNSRTPYLVGIMDALSESDPAKFVIFVKPVQIGGSEAGYNAVGTWMTESPANIMLAMPTEKMFRMVSKTRIRPMLDLCDIFHGKVSSKRDGQGMTATDYPFPGGALHLVTAKSGASLRSVNARYLVLDEVDGYPDSIPGEGSPVELLIARTATYGFNRKILMTSTPAHDHDRSMIWRYYQKTDERKYFVPCPHCNHMQTLEWANLIYDEAKPQAARMKCVNPKCEKLYDDADKDDILGRGEWRATSDDCLEGYVGFHLNALYSPHGWISFGDLAAERVAAEKDPALMNAFTNSKLGLPFKQTAYTPRFAPKEAQVDLGAANAPDDTCFITAGIDTQSDSVHIYVYAWRPGVKPFALDKLIIKGNLVNDRFWQGVYLAVNNLRYHTASGRRDLSIDMVAIDTGGNYTSEVYRFTQKVLQSPERVCEIVGIKGVPGFNKPVISLASSFSRDKRRAVRKAKLHLVGVDRTKHILYRKFEKGELNAPLKWASGERVLAGYFNEVVAEEECMTPRGTGYKLEYIPRRGIRNEALDCIVYAYAALIHLKPRWDIAEKRLSDWKKKSAKSAKKR